MNQLKVLMQETGFCNIHVRYKHSQSEENLNDFLTYASQLIVIPEGAYNEVIAKLKEYVEKAGIEFLVSSEICLVWITGDKPG